MFQHILVPTDFSERSRQALDIAVNLAVMSQGSVTLLHVIETMANTTFAEFEDFYKKLEAQAEQKMADLIAPYEPGQVAIHPSIVYGQRVQEILRVAEDHHIDLIVMNSHKINLEDPSQGWGIISYKVGVLAQCPIMLVK